MLGFNFLSDFTEGSILIEVKFSYRLLIWQPAVCHIADISDEMRKCVESRTNARRLRDVGCLYLSQGTHGDKDQLPTHAVSERAKHILIGSIHNPHPCVQQRLLQVGCSSQLFLLYERLLAEISHALPYWPSPKPS